MAEFNWEFDLNEALSQDLNGPPARKKAKVDHVKDVGYCSFDQYSSSHYIVNDGSTNSTDLASSFMFFDSTWGVPEENVQVRDDKLPIIIDGMVPDDTRYEWPYEWPSGSAEFRMPALPGDMIDDLAMNVSQSEFSCLDLVCQGERSIDNVYEGADATLEDGKEAGLAQHQFKPEVCFGMIQDILIADVQRLTKLAKDEEPSLFYDVNLISEGSLIRVYGEAGEYIGLLQTSSSNGLGLLNTSNDGGSSIVININIYGLSHDFDGVGDSLYQTNLFLQRPLKYDSAFEYKNPHYFQIPDLELATLQLGNDLANDNSTNGQQKAYRVRDDLSDLLGAATDRLRVFKPCAISDRLSTPLLEHQKHGLSYMQEKEDDDRGHQINDHMKGVGGILADGMGLGKSLTTLALIAGTLPSLREQQSATHCKATLIVAPASTLGTWQEQIERHMKPNSFDFFTYHGPQRKLDLSKLQTRDIIITTYSTLVAEWVSSSALHKIQWFRIVLDEAHLIRDPSTKRAQAVFALKAERRWCLTGTPIQNRIDDLFGILKFLRTHPQQSHRKFQDEIIAPLKNNDPDWLPRLQSMLRIVMLRRTKEILALPPREDVVQSLELSAPERELYEIFRDESRSLISTFLSENTYKRGFSVMQSFLRQRQICNHGRDLLPSIVRTRLDWKRKLEEWRSGGAVDEVPIFCEACEAEIELSASTDRASFEFCGHLVCAECLKNGSLEAGSSNTCPVCNEETNERKSIRKKGVSLANWFRTIEYRGPSTKVKALIHNIQSTTLPGSPERPKSVVFSGWTKMLYLIEKAFREAKITSVRLDGTMSLKERKSVLKDFETIPAISVLLISIGTGSVGLNLTAASQVHIMEPQWNPMVESQALDRVHRIGQKRPVKTIRYVIESSFDESILELQRMKLDLAEISLGRNEGKGVDQMRLRFEKLRDVFK